MGGCSNPAWLPTAAPRGNRAARAVSRCAISCVPPSDFEFRQSLKELTVTPIIENPKGELQEYLQAVSPEAPHYEVVSATGPDHDRVFECTVHHGGAELARGTGKSKKAAESEAALAALRRLKEEAAANPKSETRNPKEARNPNSE